MFDNAVKLKKCKDIVEFDKTTRAFILNLQIKTPYV